MTDTAGLLVGLVVHRADIQDRDGAGLVMRPFTTCSRRGAISLPTVPMLATSCSRRLGEFGHCTIELVKRPAAAIGIQPLPRRWVVERTVAWLNRNRRSAKDFEASAPVPPPGFTLLLCDSPSGGSHKYNLYDAGSDIIAVHVQRLKSEYASRTVDLEQDGYFSITHLLKRRDSALAHRAERHIDERGTKGTRWKRYRYSV